jgi:hypothetical protein
MVFFIPVQEVPEFFLPPVVAIRFLDVFDRPINAMLAIIAPDLSNRVSAMAAVMPALTQSHASRT